jgi:hypothetical protein
MPNGTVAKWIELGAMHPNANLSTLTTTNGQTVAQEIYTPIDNLNDDCEQNRSAGRATAQGKLAYGVRFQDGRIERLHHRRRVALA